MGLLRVRSGARLSYCGPRQLASVLPRLCPRGISGQPQRTGVLHRGGGGTIPNLGQKNLNLSKDGRNVRSIFQTAAPLMSVGRICDERHSLTFDAVMAVVKDPAGPEICRLRQTPGGLYVSKMKINNDMRFGLQD